MTTNLEKGFGAAVALPVGPVAPTLAAARPIPWSKRAFDIAFSLAALAFFAPFLSAVALAIRLGEGGPVIYAHDRVGQGGRTFRCLKFRTMAVNGNALLADLLARDPAARAEWAATRKLTCDPRVTPVGAFLRRTSLDELPQFWNVLRGEMSLVGPRPVVTEELHFYAENLVDYLSARPGITGLWQISGRSNTTYAERVALDVRYLRTRSFLGDIGIVLRTAGAVLRRDGAR